MQPLVSDSVVLCVCVCVCVRASDAPQAVSHVVFGPADVSARCQLSMTIATIERIGLEVDGQLVERYSDWLASDEGEEKGPGKHQRGFME
eukprot:965446-Rhodomonas_salina.4